jgi:hypothetical protein
VLAKTCSDIFVYCFIIKGQVDPRTGHEAPDGEGLRYTSTLSLTSALDGGLST